MINKKGNTAVWILVIIVLVGLVWFIVKNRGANSEVATTTTPTANVVPTTPTVPATTTTPAPRVVTVTYTANGFSPATVTINQGDTVKWVNTSGNTLWVASAMHPTHAVYSGTSLSEHCVAAATNDYFDQCKNGTEYSFTFNKIGEWGYHNHSRASDFGKVIVQ